MDFVFQYSLIPQRIMVNTPHIPNVITVNGVNMNDAQNISFCANSQNGHAH